MYLLLKLLNIFMYLPIAYNKQVSVDGVVGW